MSKSVSTNVFKKKTGIQNVREYLEAGRSITPLEALGNWGIFRLASTVEQLRKQGVNVVTKMKNDPNGKTYAEYVLGEQKVLKVGARVSATRYVCGNHAGAQGTVVNVLDSDKPYPFMVSFDEDHGSDTPCTADELEVI